MSKHNTTKTLVANIEDAEAIKKIIVSTNSLQSSQERMASYAKALQAAAIEGKADVVAYLAKCVKDEANYLEQLANGFRTAAQEL